MIEKPLDFMQNALIPSSESMKDHIAFYAIDLMNEHKGISYPLRNPIVNESSVRVSFEEY